MRATGAGVSAPPSGITHTGSLVDGSAPGRDRMAVPDRRGILARFQVPPERPGRGAARPLYADVAHLAASVHLELRGHVASCLRRRRLDRAADQLRRNELARLLVGPRVASAGEECDGRGRRLIARNAVKFTSIFFGKSGEPAK